MWRKKKQRGQKGEIQQMSYRIQRVHECDRTDEKGMMRKQNKEGGRKMGGKKRERREMRRRKQSSKTDI